MKKKPKKHRHHQSNRRNRDGTTLHWYAYAYEIPPWMFVGGECPPITGLKRTAVSP